MPVTLKQGDSFPEIEFLLEDADGPVDLSTATDITITCKAPGGTVTLTGTGDADQVTRKGFGTAPIATTDTAIVDDYEVETKVTWGVGQVQRFPNSGYESLTIEASLDG